MADSDQKLKRAENDGRSLDKVGGPWLSTRITECGYILNKNNYCFIHRKHRKILALKFHLNHNIKLSRKYIIFF